MNTYHAFYHGRKIELTAATSYAAQKEAARIFNAKKSYEVTVILVAVAGAQVTHVATE